MIPYLRLFLRSHVLLLLLLACLLVLHLFTLNRPLSKHHEFNTAIVLINAIGWDQAGGASAFHFTPLMNFQGRQNKVLETGYHIDEQGNHVYLSFGIAWYIIPYAVFKLLHISPTPLALQWLSIFWGLITTILLYALLARVTGNRHKAFLCTACFCLLPAPLWYMGNGYVTTAIMLPFVVSFFALWHHVGIGVKNVSGYSITGILLNGIILMQFDWIAAFLLAAMGAWAMFQSVKQKRYLWVTGAAAISAMLGIFFVLLPFADYLGWQQVMGYWTSRFSERSLNQQLTLKDTFIGCLQHLVTGYAPLFLLIITLWLSRQWQVRKVPAWLYWALGAILLYNLVFLNWSAIHEFAWMGLAFGLLMWLAFAYQPSTTLTKKYLWIFIGLASIGQYFLLNRPGPLSWNGDHYNAQQLLGEKIRGIADSSQVIFTNLANDKIVEYYAGRTFNTTNSPEKAVVIMKQFGISNALWIKVENNEVKMIQSLRQPQ